MFCIVDAAGNCYFKGNDANRSDFESAGSFKHLRRPYYSVPEKVFNDPDLHLSGAE
jgi:TfoX/Sxy family transcriptional regulator of competence genes